MSSLSKNKTVVYALVIFILLILGYNYFIKSGQEAALESVTAEDIGNDVVQLHESLQAVTLDPKVFSRPEYKSLIDWAPRLAAQSSDAYKRPNPFAPIGQ